MTAKAVVQSVCLLALLLFARLLSGQDFVGTWKLNLEKSRPPVSDLAAITMKIEETGANTFRSTIDIVWKGGQHQHYEDNRLCDGQEHAAQGVGLTPGTSETRQLLDSSTRKIIQGRAGKVLSEMTSKVSADGKVMTNRVTRVTKDGNRVKRVRVFDRE